MKIEKFMTTTTNQDQFLMTLGTPAEQAIHDQFTEALKEAARHYVEQNMDKITAKLDMAGLANLIALYASKKLAEDIKK